jgi:hypothetical protein
MISILIIYTSYFIFIIQNSHLSKVFGNVKNPVHINNQNIDNSECFGVTFVKIYPEMAS